MASTIDASLLIDQPAAVDAIVGALMEKCNQVLLSMEVPVKARLGQRIPGLIQDSEEYSSLVGEQGKLRGQLGVVDARSFIDTMAAKIAANIFCKASRCVRSGDGFSGTFTVGILETGYGDLLGLAGATFQSTNRAGRVTDVPWLDWLLKGGNGPLVQNYFFLGVDSVRDRRWSRTGQGIMAKHRSRNWSVPQDFGPNVEEDNWLMRALAPLVKGTPSIAETVLREELERLFV